jgi:hypothetical protein
MLQFEINIIVNVIVIWICRGLQEQQILGMFFY